MGRFFESVSEAFARNRAAVPQFLLALAVIALASAATLAWLARRQALRLRSELQGASGLSPATFELLQGWAAASGVPLESVLTSLAAFEKVTAAALAQGADPEAVRGMRTALRYEQRLRWAPLFSSRELVQGAPIHVGSTLGYVLRRDEKSMTVSLPSRPALGAEQVELFVAHGGEARYRLRCTARSVVQQGNDWQLELEHDETLERIQLRAYARVAAHETFVALTQVMSSVPIAGRLVDVSAGGALVRSSRSFAVGELLETAFRLGSAHFAHIGAVVVGTAANQARGTFDVQLEFSGIDNELRDRLVGSVNALSAR